MSAQPVPHGVPWYVAAAYEARRTPNLDKWRASTARSRARRRAHTLGHVTGPWVKDEHRTWVARCGNCSLWAGVTAPSEDDEPTGYFGSILEVECDGPGTKPTWAEED